MTPEQIAELFIKAAETDRKLPDTARPKQLKAMSLGYVHTVADMNGWSAEDKHAANWSWLDPEKLRNSRNDIGLWEAAMELIKLVRKPECRRALWAWAASKAGGMSLPRWCREVERQTTGKGIHPETARRRAKAAIAEIHRKLSSKQEMHNENRSIDVLPFEPEMGDKTSNIEVWRPAASRPLACFFDTDIAGMEYADIQNARRRERRARAAKAA